MGAFRVFAMVVLAVGLVGSAPGSSAVPPKALGSDPAQTGTPETTAPFPELQGEQAREAFHAGVLFLDARPPMDYWLGHVPSALNLPVWAKDFESRLLDFLISHKGAPEAGVVVYCGGCCSTDSLLLARRLQDFGFKYVQIYRDGYPGWARAEQPIETGATPQRMEVK